MSVMPEPVYFKRYYNVTASLCALLLVCLMVAFFALNVMPFNSPLGLYNYNGYISMYNMPNNISRTAFNLFRILD